MGANIYPTDVEYGLYRDETPCGGDRELLSRAPEASDLESRPIVHVQLRAGARVDRDAAADQLRAGLVAYLVSSSRDFAESVREDASAADIRVVLHDHAEGPFAATGSTIKNVYVIRPR